MQAQRFVVLDSAELLPDTWRRLVMGGPVRTFNPGLLEDGAGYVLASRVVLPDMVRRIALCRLDGDLRPVERSQLALSDLVRFPADSEVPERGRSWFADPRLFRLGGRIFLYWNSGWHDPHNHQFITQLDGATLEPLGPPREIVLRDERQPIEKNWTFFGDGPFFAVYSIVPQRVMRVSLEGTGAIELSEHARADWDVGEYARLYGGLRGGAPPQRHGDHMYSICHSNHFEPEGLRYIPAVYRFAAQEPFAPTDGPARPLALDNPFGPRNVHERLNPVVGEVLYPCGAVIAGGLWTISYGINDEHCAIARVPHEEVLASMRPLEPAR